MPSHARFERTCPHFVFPRGETNYTILIRKGTNHWHQRNEHHTKIPPPTSNPPPHPPAVHLFFSTQNGPFCRAQDCCGSVHGAQCAQRSKVHYFRGIFAEEGQILCGEPKPGRSRANHQITCTSFSQIYSSLYYINFEDEAYI